MFLTDGAAWREADAQVAVAQIKSTLEHQKDGRHRYFWVDPSDAPQRGPSLKVVRASSRSVACYPGWTLFKFQIDLETLDIRSGYSRADVYALTNGTHAVLLDGTSPVIHALNASTWGENEQSPLRLDHHDPIKREAAYLDYLRFFCAFVAGEDGPFLLIEQPDDLQSLAHGEAFKEFEVLVDERRTAFRWPPAAVDVPHDAMAEFIAGTTTPGEFKDLVPRPRLEWREENPIGDIAEKVRPAREIPPVDDGSGLPSFRATAHLLYAKHLFASEFAIAPDGAIEMTDDDPLTENLPVYGYKFESGLALMFLEGDPLQIKPREFIELLLDENRSYALNNIRVDGDVDLIGAPMSMRKGGTGIDIDGDLILDDARCARSVSLERLRVRGRFHARNLVCDGALKLTRLEVYGYYDLNRQAASPEEHVGLSFKGARISTEFDLTRASVLGGVDLDDIYVGGSAKLAGIRIERRNVFGGRAWGLTARGARFNRGLNIGADEDVAARIVGGIDCNAMKVEGDFDISGLDCISGYTLIRVDDDFRALFAGRALRDGAALFTWVGPQLVYLNPGAGGVNLYASVLGGSLLARRLTAAHLFLGAAVNGSVSVNGSNIEFDLFAASTKIGHMLDGDPDGDRITRIGRNVDLSGATICSDTRFCSAQIGGLLSLITGTLGRLQLRPNQVGESFECRPTEVGGVIIQSADIGSLDFYALDVNGAKGRLANETEMGSISLHGVTVRDYLSFYKTRPDRYLLHNLEFGFYDRCRQALPDLCDMRAKISRTLKCSSVIVGGEIELTNLSVDGEVDLEGVRCAKLTACGFVPKQDVERYTAVSGKPTKTEPRLSAKSLVLDRMCCTGDADLSGIDIAGSVSARSSQFEGKLSFHAEEKDTGQTASAAIGGKLMLRLARTTTLEISGDSLKDDLKLDRADVGALKLVGNAPFHADLRDLKLGRLVTDFDLNSDAHHRYVMTLLRTSWPFDRGIYRTMERSWRDHGADSQADEIYRQMRWRSLLPQARPQRSVAHDRIHKAMELFVWPLLAIGLLLVGAALALNWPAQAAVAAILAGAAAVLLPRAQEFFAKAFQRIVNFPVAMFIGLLTGFWTRGWIILAVTLGLTLPLSWLVYSVPENVAPSSSRLSEAEHHLVRSGKPSRAEWGSVEVWRLVLATHVPVIPLIDGARWEPAENRSLCILKPSSVGVAQLPLLNHFYDNAPQFVEAQAGVAPQCPAGAWTAAELSPAGYSLTIRALHWVVWPLFLLGISGVIKRREAP